MARGVRPSANDASHTRLSVNSMIVGENGGGLDMQAGYRGVQRRLGSATVSGAFVRLLRFVS